jgi:hypothetical protein
MFDSDESTERINKSENNKSISGSNVSFEWQQQAEKRAFCFCRISIHRFSLPYTCHRYAIHDSSFQPREKNHSKLKFLVQIFEVRGFAQATKFV